MSHNSSTRLRRIGLLLVALFAFSSMLPAVALAQDEEGGDEAPETSEDAIKIDVRGSARRVLMPIAVPDTLEPSGDTGDVADEVQSILRRDLEMSGFFKVIGPDTYFFDASEEGMSTSDIKFQNWFQVGSQALIKSAVRLDGDAVKIDLRLYAVDSGERISLDWSPEPATKGDYDKQVHGFVNAVIEHFTGQPGVFGSRITYARRLKNGSKQIYVAQIDGSKVARITDNSSINMLPSWANGRIYYTSYRAGNPDLWVYKGGNHEKVSSHRGQNTGAAYCGGKLAVTLSMGGENTDVYLIDEASGKVEQRLTKHWAIDTSPSFSPDCSQIAFVSGRSGGPQIYVMSADGSNQRRLTYQGDYNTQPSWAPKGSKIAFAARDERNAYDIFTVDLDGNIERLTQDQGNNEHPSYSPDGRYLVFVSDRGGKGDRIWMMTADGEVQNPVTSTGGGYASPMWQR